MTSLRVVQQEQFPLERIVALALRPRPTILSHICIFTGSDTSFNTNERRLVGCMVITFVSFEPKRIKTSGYETSRST